MNKSHGSPYDRGSADRYYGRQYQPHYHEFYVEPSHGRCYRVIKCENMTEQEMREYRQGWNETDGRKDWGDGQFAAEQADVVE